MNKVDATLLPVGRITRKAGIKLNIYIYLAREIFQLNRLHNALANSE